GQLLVEGRALDGRVGYLVLTPLRVTDDGTQGASWAELSGAPVLPVVRGWVATPEQGAALEPPAGVVRVTGYLQASEAAGQGGSAPGLTDSVSTGALVNEWGGPIYSGYLVLRSSDPEQPPAAVRRSSRARRSRAGPGSAGRTCSTPGSGGCSAVSPCCCGCASSVTRPRACAATAAARAAASPVSPATDPACPRPSPCPS